MAVWHHLWAEAIRHCLFHSTAIGRISTARVICAGCRPSRIASPQDATHVGRIDLLGGGYLRDGRVRAGFEQLPPPERPGDRLHDCVVDAQPGRCPGLGTIRCDHQFAPAALAEGQRNADRECAAVLGQIKRGRHHAALCGVAIIRRSAMRLAMPLVRKRMSTPSRLTSTRSTRN